MNSCSVQNQLITDADARSSCDSGGGSAFTCWDLVPYADTSNDRISYGYAATNPGTDICGRCYQLDFTGPSSSAPNDPGAAALAGKTMIVQAINIGGDVGSGQFDILVPGGGVGLFNACTSQWGIPEQELGAQYGGLLSACKQELGYERSLGEYKSCLTNKCDSVFGSRGLTELQNGCLWYAEWFEAADNPALKYKEVACPAQLTSATGMDRSHLNDISNACGN